MTEYTDDEIDRLIWLGNQDHEYSELLQDMAGALQSLRHQRDEALRGWKEMTEQAGRKQREHLQHHEGDVYHAMQALKVKYGCKTKWPAIDQESSDE